MANRKQLSKAAAAAAAPAVVSPITSARYEPGPGLAETAMARIKPLKLIKHSRPGPGAHQTQYFPHPGQIWLSRLGERFIKRRQSLLRQQAAISRQP